MKKRITALLMTALLVAGAMPVTAADAGADKTADSKPGQEKTIPGETSDKESEKLKDKSNAKTSKGSLSNKTKQKETDTKEKAGSEGKTNENNIKTEKSSGKKETDAEKQINTTPIAISTLEELQKIGVEEGYPLNGTYELQNDIDAGKLTELPDTNKMPADAQGEAQQENPQKITWNPIGTKENPFTGVLNGNGHLILNLAIAPAEGDAAFFGIFEGEVSDLAFVNLYTISKTGNAALLACNMNQASMKNILLNGKTELQNPDGTAYVAVDKKEAANITARKNTTTDNTSAGSQSELTVGTQSQIQSEQTGAERLEGDIAVKEKDCVYEHVNFIGELKGELPKGVTRIQTNPEYISMMKGEKEKAAAPELPFWLQFKSWELGEISESTEVKAASLELSDTADTEIEITGKSAGKALLNAVYQYGETELTIETPVIIGEPINEVEELKPVDDVFYGQLKVVAELMPIDGVFPKWMKEKAPDINGDEEEKERVQLYTWENFKNIGNTEYNPEYTMDADYVLMNDIVSDGLPFMPIGTKENPFTGSFQGQNFMIDVTLNPEINVNAEYKGLFGVVK